MTDGPLPVYLRLHEPLRGALVAVAASQGVSVNAYACSAIERAVLRDYKSGRVRLTGGNAKLARIAGAVVE